ncbi:MAG: glycosyltransferase family 39 protein [Solirubrobacteraceae bacterium]
MRNIVPRVPIGAPIVVLTALAALLRFYAIGRQGFWYDESYTSFLVSRGPGRMLDLIPHLESTPPLYYCVAWIWGRIFGFGPAALKSLSALCGTLTIPIAYAAARKLLPSRRAAIIVAALTACNPLLVWYSQEARAYAMLVLCSAASLLAFAHARERPRTIAVVYWVIACALALVTHYYAVILIVPEAAWLLYEHRRSRAIQLGVGAIVLVGLALLPLVLEQEGAHNNDWIAKSSYLLRLRQVPALFLIGPETHARTLLKFLAFALIAISVGLLIWRSRRTERQRALLPGALALGGFLLAAVPGHSTLLGRNLLPIWIPAAVFVAAGLGAARARLAGTGSTVALCAIGITAVISVDTTYAFQRPNWKLAANALGRWPAPGQTTQDGRIVVVQDNPGAFPLGLYLADARYITTPRLRRITEIDVIAALPHKGLGGFCWWGSECNLVPSRFNRRYAIPGFHIVARRRVRDFGILELRAARPTSVKRALLPIPRRHEHRHFVPSGHGVHDAQLVEQT